jgi:hypothetical protein
MHDEDAQKDLLSAALFVLIGVGAIVFAAGYPLGTLQRLGPGALPVLVGGLLVAVGFGLGVQTLLRVRGNLRFSFKRPSAEGVRATIFLSVALVAFGLLMRPAGLFIATVTLVFLATRAEANTPVIGSVVLALIVAAMSVGIFVYAIGLPIRVWP